MKRKEELTLSICDEHGKSDFRPFQTVDITHARFFLTTVFPVFDF